MNINEDALRAIKTIVTHADCPDGIASAVLLHDAMPKVEIVFMNYGPSLDSLEARPGMLFCDLTPPRARAQEFAKAGAIVLDHHEHARDIVEVIARDGGVGIYSDVRGVSGAILAFTHVWMPMRFDSVKYLRDFAELFAKNAGARDTWDNASLYWNAGCSQAALTKSLGSKFFLERSLSELRDLFENKNLHDVGYALMAQTKKNCERAAETAEWFAFTKKSGQKRPLLFAVVADTTRQLTSDLGDAIPKADVVATYAQSPDGWRYAFSLRSKDASVFDVGAFAKRLGGGGHARAAGFSYDAKKETARTIAGRGSYPEMSPVGLLAMLVSVVSDVEDKKP